VCAFLGFMRGVISEERYRAFIQESADEVEVPWASG
jgi:hypothetical protein